MTYGTGMISVVGNAIRGRGAGLTILSVNDHVLSVGRPRLLGEEINLAEPL